MLVAAPTRATGVLVVELFKVDMEAERAAHFARLFDEELAAPTPNGGERQG